MSEKCRNWIAANGHLSRLKDRIAQSRPECGSSEGGCHVNLIVASCWEFVETLRQRGETMVIPAVGMVTHRPQSPFTATTSNQEVANEARRAERAPCTKRIVLDVDSPGGSIASIPELADVIHAAVEPVITVVNLEAAGTAYWLVAPAGEIVVTRLGELVEIGVAIADDRSGLNDSPTAAGNVGSTFGTDGRPRQSAACLFLLQETLRFAKICCCMPFAECRIDRGKQVTPSARLILLAPYSAEVHNRTEFP